MIVTPTNENEWQALTGFVRHYAGVQPTPDMQCIGWVTEDTKKLVMVAALNCFMGKVANIHIANVPDWHFTPRAMLRAVFGFAFKHREVEMLIGIVNSLNERAMRYDIHLGFKEVARIPDMHDNGGDIVLLAMKRADCRYIKDEVPRAA